MAGMTLTDTRNEQTASYIADVTGRLTRRLGVCAVSSAVGHTNALIGVLNAHFDGGPMLLLSGTSSRQHWDMGVFQEMDHLPLVRSITKYARVVERAENIPVYVREAVGRAIAPRPGPVHLTVPLDVLEAEVPAEQVRWVRQPQALATAVSPGDEDLVRDAARLLAASERPVLVAGSGLFYVQGGPALAALASALALPVVTPIWDRGVVDRPQDWFLGVIGAASGSASILPDADLILLVGAQVDYRVGYGLPPAFDRETRVIRITADGDQLRQGVEPDLAILGDPGTVLRQLAEEVERQGMTRAFRPWLEETRRRDREFRRAWLEEPAPPSPPMTGRHMVDALRPFLDEQTVFLIDGGNIGQWAHMVLAARQYPSHWLTCGASGVIGWGIAGGMAARLAYPDRKIILLSGDGSFTFTLGDLERASAQGLPFVVVLADDCAWGIVVSGQCEAYGEQGVVCSRMGQIDYVKMAESFGCLGIRAESPDEIGPAIERGLAADVPTIVHVPIAVGGPADIK
ncbi:MAG: thiamine pyrophosphate-binding protein [Anaerolineae bacterium]|nr:thiamine pyrophosphate-binding protein [Anaerolineae bacterium]